MQNEKQYQKEYNLKNKQYIEDCETKLKELQEAIISKPYKRVTAYKKKNCKRCDILFKFGGNGNGIICNDCLEKNGTEYFTTKERSSLV